MLVITNPIKLYGKKVITDLATRVGDCTVDSFSYGPGMADVVRKFWHDTEETTMPIEAHFEAQKDFDCDVVKSSLSEDCDDDEEEEDTFSPYDPSKDPIDFKEYNRRLEDIAPKYLERYLGNVVFNICHRDSTLKRQQIKHKVQPCLMGNGDDSDDFTELADLQLEDKDEWSLGQKQNAQRNLSYVLKRLFNLSRISHVHIPSYIAAFERAKLYIEANHTQGGSKMLSDNVVISQGVYLCDADGNITKKVLVENKNQRAKGMFNWIMGRGGPYAAYYQDYVNFVHYCTVLDIDIVNDDMTKYQADFMDKLVVTTVTPNKQYVPAVYNALKNNLTTMAVEEKPEVDVIKNTIASFEQLCSTHPVIQDTVFKFTADNRKMNEKYAVWVYGYYNSKFLGSAVDPCKYQWINGFLHHDGKLVVMPANWLGDSSKTEFRDNRCIISELGYILALSETEDVFFLTTDSAYLNVYNIYFLGDKEYKPRNWSHELS